MYTPMINHGYFSGPEKARLAARAIELRSSPGSTDPFSEWPLFEGDYTKDLFQYLEQARESFFTRMHDPQFLVDLIRRHSWSNHLRQLMTPFERCYEYDRMLDWEIWYRLVNNLPHTTPDFIVQLSMQEDVCLLQKFVSKVDELVTNHPNLSMHLRTWIPIYNYLDEHYARAHDVAYLQCPALHGLLTNHTSKIWSTYRAAILTFANLSTSSFPKLLCAQATRLQFSSIDNVERPPLYSPYSDFGDYRQILSLMEEEGPNPYQPSNAKCHFCGSSTHSHFTCKYLEPFIELDILHFKD